jgi:hypothetical protein
MDIFIVILFDFPQSIQADTIIVPRLGHDVFLSYPYKFISHPIIRLHIVWDSDSGPEWP